MQVFKANGNLRAINAEKSVEQVGQDTSFVFRAPSLPLPE
jgi:hypothetical protein